MRDLTFDLAYVSGVMDGDGYIDKNHGLPIISLMTTSKEFAGLFEEKLTSIGLSPHITERDRHRDWTRNGKTYSFDSHYFITRAKCSPELLQTILKYADLNVLSSKQAYFAGFFHSEGCARITSYPSRTCYYLEITNNDKTKLQFIQQILSEFGVKATIYSQSAKAGCGYRLLVQTKNGYQKIIEITGGKPKP